jgi:hypothetical protein
MQPPCKQVGIKFWGLMTKILAKLEKIVAGIS